MPSRPQPEAHLDFQTLVETAINIIDNPEAAIKSCQLSRPYSGCRGPKGEELEIRKIEGNVFLQILKAKLKTKLLVV